MDRLSGSIRIKINERVYLRDPDETKLGRKIVQGSIELIDEIGFEQFTFRKLAMHIGSTEASVYRYFENKHKLLIYLVSWYWNWLEYRLVFSVNNIPDPVKKIRIVIQLITTPVEMDPTYSHVNEKALFRIVIAESSKAYLTKEVDDDNKEGYFASYKRLCRRVADWVTQVNPSYPYPVSMVSTLIESAHHQRYFAIHLPSLTEIRPDGQKDLENFLLGTLFNTISKDA